MERIIETFKEIGLTEYEAKAYYGLLQGNLNTASKLAEKSDVPRTKIYSILESLAKKGWVSVYSGVPLLFQAVALQKVLNKKKEKYISFIDSVLDKVTKETIIMQDKYIVSRIHTGLAYLKEQIAKAKSIWISNATTDFIQNILNNIAKDADLKIIYFPGEQPIPGIQGLWKKSKIKIVQMIKNKESPAISIILNNQQYFSVNYDPIVRTYSISEILYDECFSCLTKWFELGWNTAI